jgi:hypothetical protein
MSAHHAIRLPCLQFVCAAAMVEARYGTGLELTGSLEAQGISFPGQPREPLADTRTAAMIARGALHHRPLRAALTQLFSYQRPVFGRIGPDPHCPSFGSVASRFRL